MKLFIFLECFLLIGVLVVNCSDKVAVRAEVQSCSGCTLNRNKKIKDFIYEDIPEYENAVFKPVQGALPQLVLFDEHYAEIERIHLTGLSRSECNDLMAKKGFKRTAKPEVIRMGKPEL